MKRSRTVGHEKTSSSTSKAWCTATLLVTAEERSLRDVWWLLFLMNLLQGCGEALKVYLFCSSCNLQHPECGISEEDCTSLAAFDVNSRDQPSALTSRLCRRQDSNKKSHVPQAAAYFWVSRNLFLLVTMSAALRLCPAEEGFCMFCFSLSLYEYKLQSASTEPKRMCLLIRWKSGQLYYWLCYWHSSMRTESDLLGLIFIKHFLMIYIPSAGINLKD